MNIQEAIDVVYIQEDLKSFTKEKVEQLVTLLKDGSDHSLEKARSLIPKTSIETIKNTCKIKLKNFQQHYAKEKNPNISDAGAVIVTTLVCLRESIFDSGNEVVRKKLATLDRLIEKTRNLFYRLGTKLLTVSTLILVVKLMGKYLWELTFTFPELRTIFNVASTLSMYAKYGLVISIILLVLGFLLDIWLESRQEESKYKNQNKNPYEEDKE